MSTEYRSPTSAESPWQSTIAMLYAGALQRLHLIMYEMTPEDVNLVINTKLWSMRMLHEGEFDREAWAADEDTLMADARETVAFAHPEVLVISGDLIQSAMGPAWGRSFVERVTSELEVPAFTAMQAVTDSLQALDAKRVALVAPFPPQRMKHLQGYLEEDGFDLPVVRGVETVTNADIRALPPSLPLEMTTDALRTVGDVDAVYISCPVWRGPNEAIEEIEGQFGTPVVTMYSSILWRALSEIGYDRPVPGYGRLLASLGSPAPHSAG